MYTLVVQKRVQTFVGHPGVESRKLTQICCIIQLFCPIRRSARQTADSLFCFERSDPIKASDLAFQGISNALVSFLFLSMRSSGCLLQQYATKLFFLSHIVPFRMSAPFFLSHIVSHRMSRTQSEPSLVRACQFFEAKTCHRLRREVTIRTWRLAAWHHKYMGGFGNKDSKIRRILAPWLRQGLCSAFREWALNVAEIQVLKNKARIVIFRLRHGCVSRCMLRCVFSSYFLCPV